MDGATYSFAQSQGAGGISDDDIVVQAKKVQGAGVAQRLYEQLCIAAGQVDYLCALGHRHHLGEGQRALDEPYRSRPQVLEIRHQETAVPLLLRPRRPREDRDAGRTSSIAEGLLVQAARITLLDVLATEHV